MASMGSLGVHAMSANSEEGMTCIRDRETGTVIDSISEPCTSSPPDEDVGLLMAREDSEHQLYTITETE